MSELLQNHIARIFALIDTYKWISDSYISDFYVGQLWEKIPDKWRPILESLDTADLAYFLDGSHNKHISQRRDVWPLSLLCYKATVTALSLSQDISRNSEDNQDDNDAGKLHVASLSHCYRKHVKPKKQHEIKRLSKEINKISSNLSNPHVIDIGAGQGHLSRLLSFGYGLPVTTVEAVGCHAPKAEKFDQEVQLHFKKGQKRKKRNAGRDEDNQVEDGSFDITSTPNHIVHTIDPSMAIDEFLSIVKQSHDLQHKSSCKTLLSVPPNHKIHDKTIITTNTHHKECRSNYERASNCETRNHENVKRTRNDSAFENESHSVANTKNLYPPERSILIDESFRKSKLQHGSPKKILQSDRNISEIESHNYLETGQSTHSDTHLFRFMNLSKKEIAPESDTQNDNCNNNQKHSDSLHNNIKNEEFSLVNNHCSSNGFVLTGLHACGDLTPTMLRVFTQSTQMAALVSVGCCYMKLTCDGDLNGYPMSDFVKSLPSHELSFEARSAACHFNENYQQRLLGNFPELKIHSYRAALQVIIHSRNPDIVHGTVRICAKKFQHTSFPEYANIGLKKLNLQGELTESELKSVEKNLSSWKNVVAFNVLHLMLMPVIETLILLDRVLYLQENGITATLKPVFDAQISPRNIVLTATKRKLLTNPSEGHSL